MRVISLFSGAGGLDLGLIQAGNTVIWANDIDENAVATYKENIGDHIVCDDIKNIAIRDLPDAEVVVGGFPCQGFSLANRRRSIEDERNQLYRFFYDTIKEKQPKFFIAENVKGILSLGKGEIIRQIVDDFKGAGYLTEVHLVNMADYGVPQTRQRVIIVGVRNDVDFTYDFPYPTHSKTGADGLPKWVSVSKALAGIPDPDQPNDLPNHEYSKYKLNFNGYLGHRQLDPEKPAPTVTARGDNKGGVVILPHPNAERRMSCRELARIQSFPLDYEFYGNRSSVYRQIGNAVPPLLGYAVAKVFNAYKP